MGQIVAGLQINRGARREVLFSQVWNCENESVNVKVKMWKCANESVKVWKWKCENESVKVNVWKCESENVKVWKFESVNAWKCESVKVWKCESVKVLKWKWRLMTCLGFIDYDRQWIPSMSSTSTVQTCCCSPCFLRWSLPLWLAQWGSFRTHSTATRAPSSSAATPTSTPSWSSTLTTPSSQRKFPHHRSYPSYLTIHDHTW